MSEGQRRWVRYFVDYAGPVAFALTYFLFTPRDMMAATGAVVAGSVLGLIVGLVVERRLAPLPLFVGGMAVVFGGATLIFHDTRIIKMKPTFINLALAVALLGGLALKKNLLKAVMGGAVELPEAVWRRMTINFGLFYLVLALTNEIVWRTQPESVWVLFRLPGLQILTFLFVLAHIPLMVREGKVEHMPPPPTE